MNELPGPQPGAEWVICHVIPQVLELLVRPRQMVETLLLPEPPRSAEQGVNASRREVLPRLALLPHSVVARECGEQMHVVRHDYEIEQHVTVAVEMAEAVCYNGRQPRVAQRTGPVAAV